MTAPDPSQSPPNGDTQEIEPIPQSHALVPTTPKARAHFFQLD